MSQILSQTCWPTRESKFVQDILHGKTNLMENDASRTFVLPDYLTLAKFLYDKSGAALSGDHENFLGDSRVKVMVRDEGMIIENGEVVQR